MTYRQQLNRLLDEIFEASGNMTLTDMAKAAGLCLQTVSRIDRRETKLPQLRTVLNLAHAVGMDFQLVKTRIKLRRAQ